MTCYKEKLTRQDNNEIEKYAKLLSEDITSKDVSVKDAYWFLDVLEKYQLSKLTPQQAETLHNSQLRSKPKHRNAVLFRDDCSFLFNIDVVEMDDNEAASKSSCAPDPNVSLLHKSIRAIISKYYTLSK